MDSIGNYIFDPVMTFFDFLLSSYVTRNLVLLSFIVFYTYIIHKYMVGKSAASTCFGVSFVIALIFNFAATYVKPFATFVNLYESLIMTSQINIWNCIFCISLLGYAYITWSGAKNDCKYEPDNDENKKSLDRKWIRIIALLFCVYPFLLSWKTYSIDTKILTSTRIPLLLFGLLCSILFAGLFIHLKFQSTGELCNSGSGKKNYVIATGFNYLLILLFGVFIKSFSLWRNNQLKSELIPFISGGLKNAASNIIMVIGSFLSSFYGGTPLWITKTFPKK